MAIDNVLGLWKAMMPIGVIDNYGYDYKSISNSFMPCSIMGINSSTKNMKAATQFLEEALSYEVQTNDLQDGFSVNITALDGWKKRKELNSIGVIKSIDSVLTINWPSEDRINTIIEAAKNLIHQLSLMKR